MSAEGQNTIYQMVTDRIVKALEEGTVPWQKSWTTLGLAKRMSNGEDYRGVNPLLLGIESMDKGYTSPWWGTFNEIKRRGGNLRKGEHGTVVVYWKINTKRVINDDTGEPEFKKFFLLKFYKVFNAEQADDLPEKYYPKAKSTDEVQVVADAERIISDYTEREGIKVKFGGGQPAYYPASDHIEIPPITSFTGPDEYYAAFFHEMGHSTGHKSRKAREGILEFDHFGSGKYGKEELVAELVASYLGASAGTDASHVQKNNEAYIASWLKTIKGDPKLVVKAAGKAQAAADYILGTEASDGDDDEVQ